MPAGGGRRRRGRLASWRARLSALAAAVLMVSIGIVVAGPAAVSGASGGLGGLDPGFGNTAEPGIGGIAVAPTSASSATIDAGDAAAPGAVAIAGDEDTGNGQNAPTAMAVGLLSSSAPSPGSQLAEQTVTFQAGSSAAEAVASDGNDLVLAGEAANEPAITFLSAANLSLNASFAISIPGETGGALTSLAVSGAYLYAAGWVVVAGVPEIVIARFNGTSLDTTFGSASSGYELEPFPFGGLQGSTITAAVADSKTGDLVVAGSSLVPGGASCSDYDEAFLAGFVDSGAQAGAPDDTFSSGASDIGYPSPTSCWNTSFNALSVDDGTGGSGDLVAVGSETEPGDSTFSVGDVGKSEGLFAQYVSGASGFSLGGGAAVTTGLTNDILELNSVGLLASGIAGSTPGVIVGGQAYSSQLEAFQLAVQKYSISGALDTTFGSSGTTFLQCEGPALAGCGSALTVDPTGGIEVGGGLEAFEPAGSQLTSGLAVGQITDRSVTVSGPGSSIADSSSASSPAVFTITVESPSDPSLAGLGAAGLPVYFATVNGTGRSPSNYTAVSGIVTFPCNQHQQPTAVSCVNALEANVSVSTQYTGDATGSATFSLDLTNAQGASIATASAMATITYPPQEAPVNPVTTTIVVQRTTTTTEAPPTTPPQPGAGYWLVTSGGSVFSYGDAWPWGSVTGTQLNGSVVSIAATSDGKGYWLVSSNGQVYSFGDAHGYGMVAKKRLSGTIVAFAPAANNSGYWLVSSTGRVYAFGKAHNYGSVSKKKLSGTITAFATGTAEHGYWLVSSTGTVYSFGKVRNYGSLRPSKHPPDVVALATAKSHKGYWLLTAAGHVYAFGDAKSFGSVPRKELAGSAVSIVATPNFGGYWVTSSQGHIYTFGDAASYGSPAAANVNSIVGTAST